MRLRAEQLLTSLKKSGLRRIYLISGDEPLQLMESADILRNHARQEGYEERIVFDATTGFEWNTLLDATATGSLFSQKRIIELRLGNTGPGREGTDILVKYCDNPPADDLLIVTSSKLDKQAQKTRWFTALEASGICIAVWPIAPEQLPAWIKERARLKGRHIESIAATFLAEQIEGNLLAAKQEIDKLCMLVKGDKINMDDVISAVADSSRHDVFELASSALSGDTVRTLHMLDGLKGEGFDPGKIYAPFMWDLRRVCLIAYQLQQGASLDKACAEQRVWDKKRKHAVKAALRRLKPDSLHNLLRQAGYIDRMIKSSDRELAWNSLKILLMQISGMPFMPLNLAYSK